MTITTVLKATYDRHTDVLYLAARKEAASKAKTDPSGIVWRYDTNGKLVGATVMDFHDIWDGKFSELAALLAQHFLIPRTNVLRTLERA